MIKNKPPTIIPHTKRETIFQVTFDTFLVFFRKKTRDIIYIYIERGSHAHCFNNLRGILYMRLAVRANRIRRGRSKFAEVHGHFFLHV
jgi:hypothetical protein